MWYTIKKNNMYNLMYNVFDKKNEYPPKNIFYIGFSGTTHIIPQSISNLPNDVENKIHIKIFWDESNKSDELKNSDESNKYPKKFMSKLLSLKIKNAGGSNITSNKLVPLKYNIIYSNFSEKIEKLFHIIMDCKHRCIVDCVGIYDFTDELKNIFKWNLLNIKKFDHFYIFNEFDKIIDLVNNDVEVIKNDVNHNLLHKVGTCLYYTQDKIVGTDYKHVKECNDNEDVCPFGLLIINKTVGLRTVMQSLFRMRTILEPQPIFDILFINDISDVKIHNINENKIGVNQIDEIDKILNLIAFNDKQLTESYKAKIIVDIQSPFFNEEKLDYYKYVCDTSLTQDFTITKTKNKQKNISVSKITQKTNESNISSNKNKNKNRNWNFNDFENNCFNAFVNNLNIEKFVAINLDFPYIFIGIFYNYNVYIHIDCAYYFYIKFNKEIIKSNIKEYGNVLDKNIFHDHLINDFDFINDCKLTFMLYHIINPNNNIYIVDDWYIHDNIYQSYKYVTWLNCLIAFINNDKENTIFAEYKDMNSINIANNFILKNIINKFCNKPNIQ